MSSIEKPTLRFGPFELLRAERRLLEAGTSVAMGRRSFDLLVALVERAGEVVDKRELLACVWADEPVEENTLRVHIAVLRKALGDGRDGVRYITNIPGRGYCFVAEVHRSRVSGPGFLDPGPSAELKGFAQKPQSLPTPITRLLGREAEVAQLKAHIQTSRFVTLAGPGGAGKTSLAIAVANELQNSFPQGCHFVDLSNAEPGTLVGAFTSALGISQAQADPYQVLFDYLQNQHLLLVLDNCEHVLQPLTTLLIRCSAGCDGVRHLATSHVPLDFDGERVIWLNALALPPAGAALSAADALRSPAVQLFVERATASDDRFALQDADVAVVASLCRLLEGSPLAIEIAAAQVGTYGLRGLEQHLGEEPQDLLELTHRQRTVVSRHHSLSSLLDWSYQRLNADEQGLLRGLSMYEGTFPLEAADAMASAQGLDDGRRLASITGLLACSLVSADHTTDQVLLRLHGSTRQYGRKQVAKSGEEGRLRLAHTEHLRVQLQRARDDWPLLPTAAWNERHGWMVNDLRAAILRCLADAAQRPIAVALLYDLSMFAVRLFRLSDLQALVTQASGLLRQGEEDVAIEEQLQQVLQSVMHLQAGPKSWIEEGSSIRKTTRALIEGGMKAFTMAFMRGEHQLMKSHAERLATLARDADDTIATVVADRMRAQGEHFMGQHARALRLIERVLNHPVRRGHMGTASSTVDHQVSMRILLARTLWLEGRPDEAATMVQELMVHARADTPQALSQSLVMAAIPVAVWRGEWDHVRALALQLRQVLEPHAFRAMFQAWPAAIDDLLRAVETEDFDLSGCAPLRIGEASPVRDDAFLLDHLVTFHAGYVNEDALHRARSGVVGWCAPEILRAYAEKLIGPDPAAQLEAESLLGQAQHLALEQGANAWKLRIAISLYRLRGMQGRAEQGRLSLESALAGISAGDQTCDVRRALGLLNRSS